MPFQESHGAMTGPRSHPHVPESTFDRVPIRSPTPRQFRRESPMLTSINHYTHSSWHSPEHLRGPGHMDPCAGLGRDFSTAGSVSCAGSAPSATMVPSGSDAGCMLSSISCPIEWASICSIVRGVPRLLSFRFAPSVKDSWTNPEEESRLLPYRSSYTHVRFNL
jgi:hypothetical protein